MWYKYEPERTNYIDKAREYLQSEEPTGDNTNIILSHVFIGSQIEIAAIWLICLYVIPLSLY